MSPWFGHKEEQPAGAPPAVASLEAEVERLSSLPVPALASEIMVKGFGAGGPGEDSEEHVTVQGPNLLAGATASEIALVFAPGGTTEGADDALRNRLYRVIAEGLQALEHASLIRAQMHTAMNGFDYAPTRLGRTALAQDAVDRVLRGEAL